MSTTGYWMLSLLDLTVIGYYFHKIKINFLIKPTCPVSTITTISTILKLHTGLPSTIFQSGNLVDISALAKYFVAVGREYSFKHAVAEITTHLESMKHLA